MVHSCKSLVLCVTIYGQVPVYNKCDLLKEEGGTNENGVGLEN